MTGCAILDSGIAARQNGKRLPCEVLQAENSKLREQYETVLADYRSEVAKLRELVRDMAECMDNSQPRCKKCKFRELNCQWFKFDDRMRELGVVAD